MSTADVYRNTRVESKKQLLPSVKQDHAAKLCKLQLWCYIDKLTSALNLCRSNSPLTCTGNIVYFIKVVVTASVWATKV